MMVISFHFDDDKVRDGGDVDENYPDKLVP